MTMPMRVSRFEMPKNVVKDESTATGVYAQFAVEPFETGYGRTVGNSLRRVLLSSIEGAAITAVKIEGAPHEFCVIDGVVEDITDVVLNLKQVLLKLNVREPRTYKLSVSGEGEVTAGSIDLGDDGEVLNPELVIATLAEDGVLNMEIEVQVGRGFRPAELNKGAVPEIGRIPIDASFSPVQRVNFSVESAQVGDRSDYDKLVVDIWTDGRVTPDDALMMSSAILRHHLDVFVNYDKDVVEFEESEREEDAQRDELRRMLKMSINEIELSVRSTNCLNNANITTVGELASKSEADMLKYRNFGKISLDEIREKLAKMGLGLGMEFDKSLLEDNEQ
jgi:DNA-directed RNA polymerase subunit alpha